MFKKNTTFRKEMFSQFFKRHQTSNKNASVSNVPASLSSLTTNFDPSKCVVKPIPSEITARRDHFAIVIDNVLSEQECSDWIRITEAAGYGGALVNIGGGRQQRMDDVRNSSRCIVDDVERAGEIWNRVKDFVPVERKPDKMGFGPWKPKEVNERLRFLRYDPGEFFAPHYDGAFKRESGSSAGDISKITLQLYLNDGFEGGSTRFFDQQTDYFYDVVPKTGSVLLFDHPMLHSGEPVVKGRKYAVRSDIMFTR
jgi:prolyl 4-hydroxylase